jgi:hypothetical protein
MDLALELGERDACQQVGCSRATFRRHHILEPCVSEGSPEASEGGAQQQPSRQLRRYQTRQAERNRAREQRAGRRSSLALAAEERQAVLDAVHDPRFVDRSVPYIYATLLDDGTYHCSMSTMYRILHGVGEVGERRDQATRPAHVKPELCATAPRQVFAWDITKLHGPHKWSYYWRFRNSCGRIGRASKPVESLKPPVSPSPPAGCYWKEERNHAGCVVTLTGA